MSKKSTKPSIVKSFKLLDFQIYDEDFKEESDSGSDNDIQMFQKDERNFIIQMFGINEKGQTCCLYINDFKPFFYVKVGKNWNQNDANMLKIELSKKVKKFHQQSVLSCTIVDYHKLYGFSGGEKCRFVKFVFQNVSAMNAYKGLWYYYNNNERCKKKVEFKKIDLALYESNIPPLLRYFHMNSVSPSGWISFNTSKVTKVEMKTTTCNYEYICSFKNVIPNNDKETSVPYKICSFDIEASSSHGDFPVPIKTYKRFATNMVDVFLKQMTYLNEEKAKLMIEKMVLTAFHYDTFQDIDKVYAKVHPSKEKVQRLSSNLISKSLERFKKEESENNSDLIMIDTLFDEMQNKQNYLHTEADEDQEPNNDCEETSYKVYKEKKPKFKKTTKMIDILFDDKYTRDEKIKILDEVLTTSFPRLKGDEVTFIGSTFMKYGSNEPYLNNCLVVGSCEQVDGVEIESVDNEKDLLVKWTELIQKEDPDIIIGYNIFGFDYEFMFRRAQENYCNDEFLKLSRKLGEMCAKQDKDGNYNLEHTKIVLASGEYDLRYAKMSGRLQIDMYAYFRRDFNLSSYKLDDVAGQYISDSVKKIKIRDDERFGKVTELYSKNLMGLHVNDFIHIEIIGFTSDYYKNGMKFQVCDIEFDKVDGDKTYNVIIIKGEHHIEDEKSIKWGMAKDDVSPQDIFRLTNGDAKDRAIVAKYCIQDCNLVHHLMNKIDVFTGFVEMSKICSVPISFLVFRGQGIKLTSFVAKKCMMKNTLMPDIEKPRDAEGYEGAIVLPPKCKMYMDNPVACVDYSSLYPSSMISQNYSHDSKVWSKEYDLEGNLIKIHGEKDEHGNFVYDNLKDYTYIDIEFDTYKYIRKSATSRAEKTKVGKMICRWAQFPENKKGIMPSILEELLKARKDTRKMIKSEKDPFMQNILDKRQLGYKVTANSLYGQCGSRTSTFYEKDVAACTTATGRMMIVYAKRIVEEVYGNMEYDSANGKVRTRAEYVYGDTDSVFFTFNLEDANTGEKITGQKALETTIEIAQDAAELCTKWLKAPMCLEYEKTLMPFILLSKKRYVGMLYEEDPNKGYLKFMGLSLKRRDSCDYLKDVYGGILNILMKENNIENAVNYLEQSLKNLTEGNVNMDKLEITKALRGYYKNPNQIGHKVLADRIGQRDPGNKPKPGDRMKFVFIVNDKPKALMGEKIETPEYIINNQLKIDYTHYITNQLMKPIQQLFGLCLEDLWMMQNKKSAIKTYKKEMIKLENENEDMEVFMKKKEKYCAAKVKTLLFEKTLNKIYNEKHKIQQITSFFIKS